MKLKSSFSPKELKAWQKERNEACISYDVNKFRKFYRKWLALGIYGKPLPKDDIVIEITMRKMVYHIMDFTYDQREEAKAWLLEHGCDTRL